LDDLLTLAESGVLLIRDAAHAMPILGGEGANSAILDAVGFVECIASRGLDEVERFYERMCSEWETEVKESEEKLASMHSDSTYSL
jgi:2-polyprenyl-6-methoxyphenol hydroxylase-like FAD-dependent oxidoreductase